MRWLQIKMDIKNTNWRPIKPHPKVIDRGAWNLKASIVHVPSFMFQWYYLATVSKTNNQEPLQFTMKGFVKLMNSEVLIPSFRSISPPPSQKKSGWSFTIASSKITCHCSPENDYHNTHNVMYPENYNNIHFTIFQAKIMDVIFLVTYHLQSC